MFKLARFVFGVRRELRAYQDYIGAIDVGMEAASEKIERLESRVRTLETINCTLDSQVRHYRCEYHAAVAQIRKLEDYIDDLEDDGDDAPWQEPTITHELLEALEEAGLDPLRSYSVGELLDIRNALQTIRIAG